MRFKLNQSKANQRATQTAQRISVLRIVCLCANFTNEVKYFEYYISLVNLQCDMFRKGKLFLLSDSLSLSLSFRLPNRLTARSLLN